jgi:hypothetical protein
MEKTIMKPVGLISAGVLLLLIGAVAPTFAQQDQKDQDPAKQEQQAKPEKQQEAKPAKQEKQQPAKPEKQQQAKPAKQQQAKPEQQQQAKSQQEQAKAHNQQQVKPVKATRQDQQQAKVQPAQGQWAHNGQKDSRGHVYSASKFGRDHHVRFQQTGGRFYNGRREYSFGGYWFYAGAYPPWFYQQDVYFTMGVDGLWYAVAYGDPSLTCQVYIE